MRLGQRGDDRSNNRRGGRRRDADLRRLTVRWLLLHYVVLRHRLIIAVLRLALLLVHEKTAGVAVRGAADLARVRLFARVRESMLLQILEPAKRLAAGLAVIIRLAGVRGDVSLEGARFGERRAAVLTDERPIAGVCPLVIDAVRVGRETAAAVLAHVRLVARVSAHVEHQTGVLTERLAAYVTEKALEVRVLLLLGALVNPQMPLQLHLLLERLVALLARVRLRFLRALLRFLDFPVRAVAYAVAVRAVLVLFAVRVHLMFQQRFLRVVRLSAGLAGKTLALVIGIQFLPYPAVYQLDGRFVVRWFLRLRRRFSLVVAVPVHVTLQPILPVEFHIAKIADEFLLVVHQHMTLKRSLGGVTLVAMLALKKRHIVERIEFVAAGVAVP